MSNQSSSHKNWLLFALVASTTIFIGAIGLVIFSKSASAGTRKTEPSTAGDYPADTKLPENAKVQANQAIKAKQSEAKTNIGCINRSQVNYYLERQQFAKTIDEIELDLKSESENYRYSIQLETSIETTNIKDYSELTIQTAIAKKPELKSYLGVVYLSSPLGDDERVFITLLCESNAPTTNAARSPKFDGEEIKCPDGYTTINWC